MTPCCGASKFPLRPLFPATLPMCSASVIGLGAKDTPTERSWWTWNNTVSWIYCPAGPQRELRGLVEGATENWSDQPRSERSLRRGGAARFSRSNASRRPVSSPFEPLGSRRARPGRTQPPTAASVSRTTAPRFAGSELTSDKNDPARFSQTAAAPAPPRPLRTSYRAVPSGMFAEEDVNLSRSNEKRCGDGFERASFPNASRRGSVLPRSIDSPNTSSGDGRKAVTTPRGSSRKSAFRAIEEAAAWWPGMWRDGGTRQKSFPRHARRKLHRNTQRSWAPNLLPS